MLAPRVNAAGRMSTPDLATRLLLAVDKSRKEEAKYLAEQLDAENTRRRHEERDIFLKATNLIKNNRHFLNLPFGFPILHILFYSLLNKDLYYYHQNCRKCVYD